MKKYFTTCLLLPFLFSCEIKQPSVPAESKKEEEKKVIPPPPPSPPPKKITKNPVYYGRKAISVKKSGQDPSKSFKDIQSSIISGTPKHPFPPETLLE